ncbi:PREDICTED: uncharacterized protein LOC109175154 [Ipomoea nil]|uniref:uncharacterized protein LOC109175154 n=1 Tax=Ipomoea nil TaxID=35883 RepID=UPI000901BDDE|nr:PREDICTED: uncharacterized protein LOC109175154 [Ipomoea nil]
MAAASVMEGKRMEKQSEKAREYEKGRQRALDLKRTLGDPNGIYSVKNAYRSIMGDYEHMPGVFDKWTSIWKMKVPPKWRIFLWRAICDILPTTANLIIKRVDIDPICQKCGEMDEDVMHALITCDYSRLVWNITGLPITNIITDSFHAWLTAALTILTEEQSGTMVAVLYHLWQSRNSAVWEKSLPRPTSLWRRTSAAIGSYCHANHHPALPAPHGPEHAHHARPRCFVDASFRHATREAYYGAVLLSPDGSFIAARNRILPTCFSPFMAEAMACKEALSWLIRRNTVEVDLLTDCLQLRNALRQETTTIMSYAGLAVDHCRSLMTSFTYCSLSYVSRQFNLHAHALASLVFTQEQVRIGHGT